MATEVICFFLCHSLVKLFTNSLLCAVVVWLLFNSPVLVRSPPVFSFQSKWTAHQVSDIPFYVLHMPALLCGIFFTTYPLMNSWSLFKTWIRCQLFSSLPWFPPSHQNKTGHFPAHTLLSYLSCCCIFWTLLHYFHCWINVSSGYMLVIWEIFFAKLWFQWVLLELYAFQDKNWRTYGGVVEESKNQNK